MGSTREQSILYPLAEWVADLEHADVPGEVRRQARLSLLDTLGCIVAGSAHPDNQIIIRAERAMGAPGERGATALVTGDRLPVAGAAKINSAFASILELDDNTAGHGSLVTVPVGVAVAEALGLSGRDLITSMAATYEVTGRMLDMSFDGLKPASDNGMIPISAPNTAAAAAQSARLLRADAAGVLDAMNVALAFTPFSPMVNAKVGARVKPLVFSGWHVYAGVIGARYAREGLSAAEDSFESDYGGILHSVARTWDAGVLTRGLGEQWYLDAPNRKRHACCGYTHSSIDGTWAMLRENGLGVSDIAGIQVDLPAAPFELVGSPLLGELTPRGAQFHLPYVLTAALLDDAAITPAHTAPATLERTNADPQFRGLMESIHVTMDDGLTGRYTARLRVTTRDGRSHTRVFDDAVGRGGQQFSAEDIEEKFRALASGEMSDAAVEEVVHMVREIEQLDDVSELVRALTP